MGSQRTQVPLGHESVPAAVGTWSEAGQARPRWRRAWMLLRESVSGADRDYTSGGVGRAVLLLAIPMMLEMAMESVFAVVDIFFVSGLGAGAIATVGLTEAVLTLLYAVAVGLSMGVTALIARRIGERDPEAAAVVAGQTIWVGVATGVLVGVLGVAFAGDILRLMGAGSDVLANGQSYTALMLGGSTTILLLFLLNAIFRGAGNAALAMRVLWLANGINIVLDPCLIYGWWVFPELGVTGAAVATNIGRGIGVLYALHHLLSGSGRLKVGLSHLRIAIDVLSRLLRVSAGGVLQFVIATSSYIVLMRLVSEYGSAAVAGYTIAIRIIMFTLLPAWGLSNAAATLVGQNLGAAHPERAEQSVWCAAKYNAAFLISIAVLFIAFARPLVGIFTTEAAVLDYGATCLRVVSYGYGFYAVGMIVIQAFNGAGDTDTPTWVNLFCFWLLQLPLAYWLAGPVELGPDGVFWAVAISESLMAVVGVVLFRRGRWKLKVV
jgi:putative MATE family efflux protein